MRAEGSEIGSGVCCDHTRALENCESVKLLNIAEILRKGLGGDGVRK